jgi:hypothetical protein
MLKRNSDIDKMKAATKLNHGSGAFTLRPHLWIWSVISSQDDTFWLSCDTKPSSLEALLQ